MKKTILLAILFVVACGGKSNPAPTPGTGSDVAEKECKPGGCSGTICTDEEGMMTTCEWKPEYACYKEAECKRQSDGACGWTQSETLTTCLASPPVGDGEAAPQ
jgi:hypothetical protein